MNKKIMRWIGMEHQKELNFQYPLEILLLRHIELLRVSLNNNAKIMKLNYMERRK